MSLASGTGGKRLGTEPLPALPSFAPSEPGRATGALFARELERAEERTHGTGRAAERLEALDAERRAQRREGFGRERKPLENVRAAEGSFHPRQEPVTVAPAADVESAAAPQGCGPSADACAAASSTDPEAARAPAPAVAEPTSSAAPAPLAQPVQAAAVAQAPASNTSAAQPLAARAEPAPLEAPAGARPAASARPAAPPARTAAPEMLQRAEEILRQVEMHLAPGVKRLALELQPAELGRMAIQLALRGGKLTAIVRAQRAETLEALEQREEGLRQVLAQRGVAVDSLRFELGFRGSRSGAHARARSDAARPSTPGTPRRGSALVDLYA